MKKIVSVLIALVLLYSFSLADGNEDITFCNIPWLSDDTTVIGILKEAGLIREGISAPEMIQERPFICRISLAIMKIMSLRLTFQTAKKA